MDAQTVAALDETRALTLGLIEVLSEKFAPGATFQKILSQKDVENVMAKQAKIVAAFQKEREERSRGLVLPPGART